MRGKCTLTAAGSTTGKSVKDAGVTFKVELLLIVGLIVASLVLAPMLEGTRGSRRSSVSVMLRGIPTIIITLTVLHRPAADP